MPEIAAPSPSPRPAPRPPGRPPAPRIRCRVEFERFVVAFMRERGLTFRDFLRLAFAGDDTRTIYNWTAEFFDCCAFADTPTNRERIAAVVAAVGGGVPAIEPLGPGR